MSQSSSRPSSEQPLQPVSRRNKRQLRALLRAVLEQCKGGQAMPTSTVKRIADELDEPMPEPPKYCVFENAQFTADGSCLVAGFGDGHIRMMHVRRKVILEDAWVSDNPVTVFVPRPCGVGVLVAVDNFVVSLWGINDDAYFSRLKRMPVGVADKCVVTHHDDGTEVTALAISGSGKVIASGDDNGIVRLTVLPGGPRDVCPMFVLQDEPRVKQLAMDEAGGIVASIAGCTATVTETKHGSALFRTMLFGSGMSCISVAPDGGRVAIGTLVGVLGVVVIGSEPLFIAHEFWGGEEAGAMHSLIFFKNDVMALHKSGMVYSWDVDSGSATEEDVAGFEDLAGQGEEKVVVIGTNPSRRFWYASPLQSARLL